MKIAFSEPMGHKTIEGKTVLRAVIVSDTTPAKSVITGADVDGIADDVVFSTGSILLDLSAGESYVCGETESTFVKWG